jgi:hypothetical protein
MSKAILCADASVPFYIECGCCGHFHPKGFYGDCRNDAYRFTSDQLDEKHGGREGWDYLSEEDQLRAEDDDGA